MKKTLLLTALILAVAFSSGAGARMTGADKMPADEQAQLPQDMPDMMGPGMMGGCGMGYGMMGGYGMGYGMMRGYGMGPRMMGNCGCGMGPGMMGGHGFWRNQEKYRKFLDETRDLRKKLYDMRFDYREMLRNPDTTMKDKMEMEKKMFDLRQQIMGKAPQ
ncbi:MAG: hypothetical protein P8130_09575 [Deltaproteobacteria bacterium]